MDIWFDTGADGQGAWFAAPQHMVVATELSEVARALRAVDDLRARGFWVAGYASYELGFALDPKLHALMPRDRRLPLLCFAAYDGPALDRPAPSQGLADVGLDPAQPDWSRATYQTAFEHLHAAIGAGDVYQGNLTFGMTARATGTPQALYAALAKRQPVPHGALVLQADGPALLSRSPELFFETDAQARITTRPMKGTQPRGVTPAEDAANAAFLQSDPKNRAENLMIVDLLRNDISRITEPGSVKVPQLFEVESYATVHQMVSTVTGQMRAGTGISDIFHALFPCGSITGAPKIRAMEILRDLEPKLREAYCGTIGWAAPDGRSRFNVAIRTLMLDKGVARFNVGGGIVWDSTAEAEYDEALWKARFAAPFAPTSDTISIEAAE